MENWKKTGCVLCAQNCGIEVLIENDRMVKVRPDKDNPRSKGYICRKGMNVQYHEHNADRLTTPLKRTDTGFVPISWDQALDEIAEKLRKTVDTYGPKSVAYMGGGGQGQHFEAAFALTLLRGLGSKYHYTALGQELTGYFFVCGRMGGRQNRFFIPHEDGADMILAAGWNGMESHQMPRAPMVLREFSKNPDKVLAVIDPRRSETAAIADIHIPLQPGTDALLVRAMISLILKNGWENREYITQHTSGFDKIESWFRNFDIEKALQVCQVSLDDVTRLCSELSTRKWCLHTDLGILMNRHSTVTSYMYNILAVICGRAYVEGGCVVPSGLVPLGSHSDERKSGTWRTVTTDFPSIFGVFPPNVMPEEILGDNPERLRAVIVSGSNPLRSYADTTAYEKAFAKLDLLVTIEIAMTETASLSDYVLPALSGYECFDATFFAWTWPGMYFQFRQPIVPPPGDGRENGMIYTALAEKLGLIPDLPTWLYRKASRGPLAFAMAFFSYMQKNPKAAKVLPFILAKTLGQELGSAHRAMLWGILAAAPPSSRKAFAKAGFTMDHPIKHYANPLKLARAIGNCIRYKSPAPLFAIGPLQAQSQRLFKALHDHPEGLWIGYADPDNWKEIRTGDKMVNFYIPELENIVLSINPEEEEKALTPDPDYPLILQAGRHIIKNANTLMRDPSWLQGKRGGTLAMHPEDASRMSFTDGQTVRITTEAGEETVELEIDESVRKGQVLMPHGFGLIYDGKKYGANVNRLTKNTYRDPIAGTPLHRYVRCRVEAV